jgi:uroporphyrinogen III methyltransferase/synthase
MKSCVYLVGAGPGDPGLITSKGLELVKEADVIVYDYLSNPYFLTLAKQKCKLINAGKRLGFKALSQDQINMQLIKLAKEGYEKIVRLKGGDPFLFGRGGEEAEELKKNKIKFEIVPGITSAIAVPAYAGIPVTHRDSTSTLAIVTGHEDPNKNKSSIDWSSLSKMRTIVFLMGTKNLKKNISSLIKNGMSPKTPIAAINWGTYSKQKTVVGNFDDIFFKIKKKNIKSPSIIIVGDVCKMKSKLDWFERKPLFGKNIIVTRARKNASTLSKKIIELGGNPIEIPTIEIKPKSSELIQSKITNINKYEWLVFTSVNGVEIFFKEFINLFQDIRKLGELKIAVIGSETGRAVKRLNLKVDLIPKVFTAEGLLESFKKLKINDSRIFIPRASRARDDLIIGLKQMGNKVKEVKIYDTVMPSNQDKKNVESKINGIDIHYTTFTSSSTVDNFFKYVNPKSFKLKTKTKFVSIGPITSKRLKAYGIKTDLICKKFTIDNMLNEIVKYNK